jgi:NAD+ synthase (glutamine-hydrolysing)
LKELTTKLQIPVIEMNQVGAQGSLIFDGRSIVLDATGKLVDELAAFDEDFRVYNLSGGELRGSQEVQVETDPHEIALIHRALVFGIRDYFGKNGFRKALIGFSGGLDSSLVGALACEALGPENVKGILMPSMYSTDHSVKDAQDLARNLGCASEIVPIKEAYDVFKKLLDPVFRGAPEDVTEQNIQARVRAVILMSISNKEKSIVLNTSNKSEAAMGYGTLYGDLVGSLSVLGDVYKSQIFEIARYINRNGVVIPENTISKPPSAELAPGQKDSDALPEYDILDPILFQLIEKGQRPQAIIDLGFDPYEVNRVVNIMGKVGFKLFQTPPALRVSPKAFGSGYQLPLVANFSR